MPKITNDDFPQMTAAPHAREHKDAFERWWLTSSPPRTFDKKQYRAAFMAGVDTRNSPMRPKLIRYSGIDYRVDYVDDPHDGHIPIDGKVDFEANVITLDSKLVETAGE